GDPFRLAGDPERVALRFNEAKGSSCALMKSRKKTISFGGGWGRESDFKLQTSDFKLQTSSWQVDELRVAAVAEFHEARLVFRPPREHATGERFIGRQPNHGVGHLCRRQQLRRDATFEAL